MKKLIITLIFFYTAIASTHAQGITPPSQGKAVVYFVRVKTYASPIVFIFFDSSRVIGKFKGQNYIRYECDPGEHLFSARSERNDFITANLEAGKIYFVEVVPSAALSFELTQAVVYLVPIDPKLSDRTEKIKEVIVERMPQTSSKDEIEKETGKLKDKIPKAIEKYYKDVDNGKKFKRLEKNMFYEGPAK